MHLHPHTPRSGEQAALGADLLALMDALGIPRAVLELVPARRR
jgi:hypothetical protein